MTDFPQTGVTPLFLHTWSRYSSIQPILVGGNLTAATITWPVGNSAFYLPFAIPFFYPVKRAFWINGTSVTSVSMDFGIYTEAGTRIYSTGVIAESGTSATQYVTPSPDFLLAPGRYYFGLSCTSSTASRGGIGNTALSVNECRIAGLLQEASASPLPATMTGATVANVCVPLCGVTRTASGF